MVVNSGLWLLVAIVALFTASVVPFDMVHTRSPHKRLERLQRAINRSYVLPVPKDTRLVATSSLRAGRLRAMDRGLSVTDKYDALNGQHAHDGRTAAAFAKPLLDPGEFRKCEDIRKAANMAKHAGPAASSANLGGATTQGRWADCQLGDVPGSWEECLGDSPPLNPLAKEFVMAAPLTADAPDSCLELCTPPAGGDPSAHTIIHKGLLALVQSQQSLIDQQNATIAHLSAWAQSCAVPSPPLVAQPVVDQSEHSAMSSLHALVQAQADAHSTLDRQVRQLAASLSQSVKEQLAATVNPLLAQLTAEFESAAEQSSSSLNDVINAAFGKFRAGLDHALDQKIDGRVASALNARAVDAHETVLNWQDEAGCLGSSPRASGHVKVPGVAPTATTSTRTASAARAQRHPDHPGQRLEAPPAPTAAPLQ